MPARAMARLLWELPKPKMIGCRSSRMILTAFVTLQDILINNNGLGISLDASGLCKPLH